MFGINFSHSCLVVISHFFLFVCHLSDSEENNMQNVNQTEKTMSNLNQGWKFVYNMHIFPTQQRFGILQHIYSVWMCIFRR